MVAELRPSHGACHFVPLVPRCWHMQLRVTVLGDTVYLLCSHMTVSLQILALLLHILNHMV